MSPIYPHPLGISIPSSIPPSQPPIARKAVPVRKPVGQGVSTSAVLSPCVKPSLSQSGSNGSSGGKICTTLSPPGATATLSIEPSISHQSASSDYSNSTLSSALSPTTTQSSFGSATSYSTSPPLSPNNTELPPGWSSSFDPDGRAYFINHATRTSSWAQPEWIPSPLPVSWEERSTPDGKVYFFNSCTFETTWERPVCLQAQKTEPNLQEQPVFTSSQAAQYSLSLASASVYAAHQVESPTSYTVNTSPKPNETDQPLSTISQGAEIEWETPQWQRKSSRRRRHFSLSSMSSASTNTISKLKLPQNVSSSSMIKGTKNAAELGMKGVKGAGKVIRNNKKVLGVGFKVVNVILRETTGFSMDGLDGFFDCDIDIGGDDDGGGDDCVGDDGGEEEPETADDGEEEVVVEEVALEDQECQQVTTDYVQQSDSEGLNSSDIFTGQEATVSGEAFIETTDTNFYEETSISQQEVVFEEETFVQNETVPVELTEEQQAAYCGAFCGDTIWAQDTVIPEEDVWTTETCDTTTYETQEDIYTQDITTIETSYEQLTMQETVEETTFQQTEECAIEDSTVEETTFEQTTIQETTIQETTFEENTLSETTIEQVTVQETVIQETVAPDDATLYSEEVTQVSSITDEQSTVVSTEYQSTEITQDASICDGPTGLPTDPTTDSVFVEVPQSAFSPPMESPAEYFPVPAPEVPAEPFVFQPVLAGPMMVEPPSESNGVVFAPIYV